MKPFTSKTASKAGSKARADSDTSAERRRQPVPVGSGAWRMVAATALLTAASVSWAAYPLDTGRPGTKITVVVAIAAGVLTIAQVAMVNVPRSEAYEFGPTYIRYADWLLSFIRGIPWPEIVVVTLVVLEALHRAKPWHTGILGVALLAYLFAVHLAETGARPSVLRAQLPVIAAGIGLLAIAVGVASVHEATTGAAFTALRMLAIVVAVVAAALVVPVGRWHRS
jgi:hypothetical protein